MRRFMSMLIWTPGTPARCRNLVRNARKARTSEQNVSYSKIKYEQRL